MFSLFSKSNNSSASIPLPTPTSLDLPLPNTPTDSNNVKRAPSVISGIKAEQERADILQEQIVILSEKTAQAYDKVAEVEAENKRLLENIKNLETLLKEKSQISKRKTSSQELLDLKIQNNSLNDQISKQSIEILKLKNENKSLKTNNLEISNQLNSQKKENSRIKQENDDLGKREAAIKQEVSRLNEEIALLKTDSSNLNHERDNSLSSLSESSTMFSYNTRNSSTDELNRVNPTPTDSKQLYVLKSENENLQSQLNLEKQKRQILLKTYKDYQEKTSLLSDFNSNYINQLLSRVEDLKKNEAHLKQKMNLIQKNMSLIRSNSKAVYR